MAPSVIDPDVFVGIDMAKEHHYAQAISRTGVKLFKTRSATTRRRSNNSDASVHGQIVVVIDQPASGTQLLLSLAAQHQIPVDYVTGLQMRRAADLYADSAKTDPIDAFVLADFARCKVRTELDRLAQNG